jgi:hypothetical protein
MKHEQYTRRSPHTEIYRDEDGRLITREEAQRKIRAMKFSYNVALGYTFTWGGLIKRLLGLKKTL